MSNTNKWLAFTAQGANEQAIVIIDTCQRLLATHGATKVVITGRYYLENRDGTTVLPIVPDCLVGHILHELGFDLALIDASGAIDDFKIDGLHWQSVVILAAMQGAQDAAATWHQAYTAGFYARNALFGYGHLPA